MDSLNLVVMPHRVLREKASLVEEINQNTKDICNLMLQTMYQNKGIGLAANQVNILQRIVVIDLQEDDQKNPIFLINPEIISKSNTMIESEEGCLSLPGIKDTIKRYETVVVKYLDLNGKIQKIEATDLLSYCLQHEIDHLNGLLFIDHLSNIKKNFVLKRYNKLINKKSKPND